MTMGTMAVDVFFLISGFLVFGSLWRSQSIVEYAWARILRIYPALLVMLLLVVFVVGPLLTTTALDAYFQSPQTYCFLAKCATLFAGVATELPGLYEDNPLAKVVNGSLWTMPSEVRLYAVLGAMWLVAAVDRSRRLAALGVMACATAVVAGSLLLTMGYLNFPPPQALPLLFMFFVGATCFVYRSKVVLSTRVFFLIVATYGVAMWLSTSAFTVIYKLSFWYVVLYLAYVPAGAIRSYTGLGDYSYGTYIYAFPVQQSLAALMPGLSVAAMIGLSALITCTLAVLSWHVIEARALRWKQPATRFTRRQSGLLAQRLAAARSSL